jgi:glycine hydroxymethyltransferase
LMDRGIPLISGGTDSHLVLLDLRSLSVTGSDTEKTLDKAHITCNKNGIPFDPLPPSTTSGIRLGSPACTTRGLGVPEFEEIGHMVADVIHALSDHSIDKVMPDVSNRALSLCKRFPIYGEA